MSIEYLKHSVSESSASSIASFLADVNRTIIYAHIYLTTSNFFEPSDGLEEKKPRAKMQVGYLSGFIDVRLDT
jgi:hypothetical protein